MPSRVRRAALASLVAIAACNEGLQPTPACPPTFVGICGTATFQGAVPDSTDGVFIVAYQTFPQSRADLFNFKPPPPLQSLPQFTGPVFYTVRLPSGRYEWVVAVWKKQGLLVEDNLREAGFYRDKADMTKPGVVVVNGGATDSIDFVIDFGNMHRICTYFPPCPP